MIKVFSIGRRQIITDPQTKNETETRLVTFVEEGRGGANASMDETSRFLSAATGTKVGLPTRRTHSHPIPITELEYYTVGKEIPGLFINRISTSVPQMEQQRNVSPRMINGKLTYFSTYISNQQEEDKDERVKLETVALFNAALINNSSLRVAEVKVLEDQKVEQVQGPVHQPLANA